MSEPIQDTLFGGAATPEPTITPTLPAAADTVIIDRALLDCLHDVVFSAWGLAADEAIDAMATTAGQAAATRRGPHKHSGENWPQMKKQLADQHADHIRTPPGFRTNKVAGRSLRSSWVGKSFRSAEHCPGERDSNPAPPPPPHTWAQWASSPPIPLVLLETGLAGDH